MNTDNSSELNTWLELKYGPISFKMEWFDQLPEEVINLAFDKMNTRGLTSYDDRREKSMFLSVMLPSPPNRPQKSNWPSPYKCIKEALFEYHSNNE